MKVDTVDAMIVPVFDHVIYGLISSSSTSVCELLLGRMGLARTSTFWCSYRFVDRNFEPRTNGPDLHTFGGCSSVVVRNLDHKAIRKERKIHVVEVSLLKSKQACVKNWEEGFDPLRTKPGIVFFDI
jgi:hypothetical protein